MVAECPINVTQIRLSVVDLDLSDELGVVDLSPEVIGMSLNSVVTAVGLGYHQGQHFTLSACQR